MAGLVGRVLGPSYVPQFVFQTIPAEDGFDVYQVAAAGGRIQISGNTGVAMASGLYRFLGDACNVSVTWGVNGTGDHIDLPATLPRPAAPIQERRAYRLSYAWNVCTASYSGAWWDWPRWERELDFMALHGVNMPLMFTGQEAVLYDTFAGFGLTDAEILRWFGGPAFLAWARMGNLRRWGGPLDEDWREGQAALQQAVLARAQQLGMFPVLPGFAGHVPQALQRVFPNSTFRQNGAWAGFNATYSETFFVDPQDSLFAVVGDAFYRAYVKRFAPQLPAFWNMDLYNEMEPKSTDPAYLRAANAATFAAMAKVDPNGTYVMQGWLFHEGFWTPSRVQAYLSGVPRGRMVVLDLNAEDAPVCPGANQGCFGQDFLWCGLQNYGGRAGMYGDLNVVATAPMATAASYPNMVGTGYTPEAIEHDPVYFELLTDISWHASAVNTSQWLQGYVRRRYGSVDASALQAWGLLLANAYGKGFTWSKWSVVEYSPAITMPVYTAFNWTAYTAAFRALHDASRSGAIPVSLGPYHYDLVDLLRQVLSDFTADLHALAGPEYQRWQFWGVNSSAAFVPLADSVLAAIADLDAVLATDPNFLFGVWQASAARAPNTTTTAERANRIFNARNQLTLWGPTGQINDYAAKQWAGLVGDYYHRRWELLLSRLSAAVVAGTKMDFSQYATDLLVLEQQWNAEQQAYPDTPSGDLAAVAAAMRQKYVDATPDERAQFRVVPAVRYPSAQYAQVATRDRDQLIKLCLADSHCAGITCDGWATNATSVPPAPSPGCDFLQRVDARSA